MQCGIKCVLSVIFLHTLLCIDKSYMLKNYKTEPCPRWFSAESNRVCRLGAMCPYYHTFRDRRRKLSVIKYRYFCFLLIFVTGASVTVESENIGTR